MPRSRRSLVLFALCQAVIVALVWGIASTSAQKPAESGVKPWWYGMPEELMSSGNRSSAVTELPPVKAGHGYVSLLSGEFRPATSDFAFTNYGKGLLNGGPGYHIYIAPLDLPAGARVTAMTMLAGDVEPDPQGSRDGTVALFLIQSELDRFDVQSNPSSDIDLISTLSYPNTADIAEFGVYTTEAATQLPPIDPTRYDYFLKLDMPTQNMAFRSVRIEYVMPISYNLPVMSR